MNNTMIVTKVILADINVRISLPVKVLLHEFLIPKILRIVLERDLELNELRKS